MGLGHRRHTCVSPTLAGLGKAPSDLTAGRLLRGLGGKSLRQAAPTAALHRFKDTFPPPPLLACSLCADTSPLPAAFHAGACGDGTSGAERGQRAGHASARLGSPRGVSHSPRPPSASARSRTRARTRGLVSRAVHSAEIQSCRLLPHAGHGWPLPAPRPDCARGRRPSWDLAEDVGGAFLSSAPLPIGLSRPRSVLPVSAPPARPRERVRYRQRGRGRDLVRTPVPGGMSPASRVRLLRPQCRFTVSLVSTGPAEG